MTADIENTSEKSPLIVQNTIRQKMSTGYAVWAIMALVTTTLLVTLLFSYDESISSGRNAQSVTSLAVKGVIRTSGQQPIKKGCANLYGSDYHQFPNTDALVICESLQLTSDKIDDFGFAPTDPNHGITYIETGAGITVTLFLGKDFTGDSYTVDPNKNELLDDVPLPGYSAPYSGKTPTNWNDQTQSLVVFSHDETQVKIAETAIVTIVEDVKTLTPSPACAILFGSNPDISPHTSGVLACAGSSQTNWIFTKADLASQGIVLDSISGGTSYVKVGADISLTVYSGPSPDCVQFGLSYCRTYSFNPGTATDLSKLFIPNDKLSDGHEKTWDNNVLSFELVWVKKP
jgi:hypothetical protein